MPPLVSMKQLLEAGVHFGHQTRKWNPSMRRFIFTERNGIHIIDLQQTVTRLNTAYDFVRDLASDGGVILFVGTKKQAQEAVETEARRAGMPYVNNRWLGGTLTNWQTIQTRIDHLLRLEDARSRGEYDVLPKKEQLKIDEEIERLNRHFGGVKELNRLPDALFIVDPPKERNATLEALRMKVRLVAMCDTNSDPDEIDFPIPSNDDAIRAVKLLTAKMADACIEGRNLREAGPVEEAEEGSSMGDFSDITEATFTPDDQPPAPVAAVEPVPAAEG